MYCSNPMQAASFVRTCGSFLARYRSTLSRGHFAGRPREPRESLTEGVAQCGLGLGIPRKDNPKGSNSGMPLRLMPLGGSITYGVGSPDGNGYRKALYDTLVVRGYMTTMVGSRQSGTMDNNHHEGWRGLRIEQIHAKAKKSITAARLSLSPDVYLVNAGLNDCLQDSRIGSAGARLDALVEDLWAPAAAPVPGARATVILSTLLVSSDRKVNARVRSVNEQIRDLVKMNRAKGKHILLAEMYDGVEKGPGLQDLGDDGIHPNAGGYSKMAMVWANSIDVAFKAGMLRSSGGSST
ncbi:SGNH hydrolase-type esterase domain-containing protein [Aspergillus multicolor]|uniref:SGNH/GDSL hydrolase family protein n=1 Tax=Aspergillus multicolor TaxID=41759 RepID=UPI003CCDA85E